MECLIFEHSVDQLTPNGFILRGHRRKEIILGALILASFQSATSELQAPAWSCLAEPSPWPDTERERVLFCCRALPRDGASALLGQHLLSKTLYTHGGWTGSFQSGHA